MKIEGEMESEVKCYKITLMRFGKAIVTARTRDEAAEKAIHLTESEIEWLSEKDGISGERVISLVELLDKKM